MSLYRICLLNMTTNYDYQMCQPYILLGYDIPDLCKLVQMMMAVNTDRFL